MLLTARFFQGPARLLKVHLVHRNSALSTFTRPGDEGGREPSPCTPPRSFRQSTGAWLEEALAKTPKNDLSDQKTFSKYRHPTIESISTSPPPRRFSEFDDATLALMASQGVHGAFKERMLREVMRRDGCDYGEAYAVLAQMNVENERMTWLYRVPYRLGMGTTFIMGLGALPMVFDRDLAVWFCENYVKEEIPSDPEVLNTMFKVGTWTWTWMEPMIGTASFVLLSFQLIRSHMQRIDLKPFGRYMESRRADFLAKKFPRYEREFVRDYAKSDPWGRDTNIARRGYPANSVLPNRVH